MKHTMTKLALLLAMLAAGNGAWAQVHIVQAGVPYTFSSDIVAGGGGTITYQWYRNNDPIDGATDAFYNLPPNLAHGTEVEFRRGAVSSTCPYSISYANAFVITFLEPLTIGNIRWAQYNVAQPSTFAEQPDMYTEFYQWNRTTAWPATGSVSGWNSTNDQSGTWTNNGQPPCPAGWRLPTQVEFQALHDNSTPAGGTWVAANAKGNAVAGRFYGPNSTSCTLPANMEGCIFLPAVGTRDYRNGSLSSQGSSGIYWSSMEYDWGDPNISNIGSYTLYTFLGDSDPGCNLTKTYGHSLRCVQ